MSPPEWITRLYIEKSLRKGLNLPNLKIRECKISQATNVGDHYSSSMLQGLLTIQKNKEESEENLSVIIKIPPPGTYMERTRDLKPFGREISMFTKILPKMNELLLKAFPDHEKLYAECYFGEEKTAQESILILEDLRQSGFILNNQSEGLDMDHTTLVLKSLAKLHVSSLIVVDNDPEIIDLYDKYQWSPGHEDLCGNIFRRAVHVVGEVIKRWENEPKKEIYYRKIKALEEIIVEKIINIFKRDVTKINVICHGDAWITNMLFRYDNNNQVNGMKFLDFQLAHYNNPVFDLIFFIFTTSQNRFNDIDPLLKIYYDAFLETINKLDYQIKKPFSLEILKNEFKNQLFYGLAISLSGLPATPTKSSDDPKMDVMLDDSGSLDERLYNSKMLSRSLKVVLPYFERLGVF